MGKWIKKDPADEEKAEKELKEAEASKKSSIEFFPEEPKYSFDEIILPQSVFQLRSRVHAQNLHAYRVQTSRPRLPQETLAALHPVDHAQ